MPRLEIEVLGDAVDRDGDETGTAITIDGKVDFERAGDGTVKMTLRLEHQTLREPLPIKRRPPSDDIREVTR
jgi:hypothetical protein